jgi:hypothetical protein
MWIRIYVVFALGAASLTSQTFGADVIRGAQARQQLVVDMSAQRKKEIARIQELERQRFEARFREFVKAMNNFIDRYNSGDGHIWPQHEAEQLGKAMHNVEGIFQTPRKSRK